MRRTALVLGALAEVQKLREADFRGAGHLAIQLLASYPEGESLPDLLWADLPDDASVKDIADLLSLWSWRTDDNGARIMRGVERWIRPGRECEANRSRAEPRRLPVHRSSGPCFSPAIDSREIPRVGQTLPADH